MYENELLEIMRKDRALAAVMWAFFVAVCREKGHAVVAPQFTTTELREAVDRVKRNKDKFLEHDPNPHQISAALSYLREQLEASA